MLKLVLSEHSHKLLYKLKTQGLSSSSHLPKGQTGAREKHSNRSASSVHQSLATQRSREAVAIGCKSTRQTFPHTTSPCPLPIWLESNQDSVAIAELEPTVDCRRLRHATITALSTNSLTVILIRLLKYESDSNFAAIRTMLSPAPPEGRGISARLQKGYERTKVVVRERVKYVEKPASRSKALASLRRRVLGYWRIGNLI